MPFLSLYDSNAGTRWEGEGFAGARVHISELDASFFLPDEGVSSYETMRKVANEDYARYEKTDENGGIVSTFDATVKTPYFKFDSALAPEPEKVEETFPHSTRGGVFGAIAENKKGDPISLHAVNQFNTMKLDYNGFYSASVTIVQGAPESAAPPEPYELVLDRPFCFQIEDNLSVDGKKVSVPLILGQIVDPGYLEA